MNQSIRNLSVCALLKINPFFCGNNVFHSRKVSVSLRSNVVTINAQSIKNSALTIFELIEFSDRLRIYTQIHTIIIRYRLETVLGI